MTEIKKVDFSRFLQNQDFTLHELLIAEVKKINDQKVKEVLNPYEEIFNKYDEVLKVGGKSPHSQKLADLDKLMDKAYIGMATQNRAMLLHFDPEKAEVAYQVDIILKKYGNPCHLPYLQQNAVIKNLIQDLETFDNKSSDESDHPVIESLDDTEDRLLKIALRDWLEELKKRHKDFMTLYNQRNAEDAAIVTGATNLARSETDKAWYIVARRINSLADINGVADYIDVINNINQLLDKELAALSAHRTTTTKRNAKKKAEKPDDHPVIE